jgi:hypothetical protein
MTFDGRDIWTIAQIYVTRYRDEALMRARARANELLAAGNRGGYETWLSVIAAVAEIQAREWRGPGSPPLRTDWGGERKGGAAVVAPAPARAA